MLGLELFRRHRKVESPHVAFRAFCRLALLYGAWEEGSRLGDTDGFDDGILLGLCEGDTDGTTLGSDEGRLDGLCEGEEDGNSDGSTLGLIDGDALFKS